MDNRCVCEEYAAIGRELIENEPELEYIRDSDVKIIYLSSDCPKKDGSKIIRGMCERVQDKYRWSIPCDFTVTVFEPNVENFDEEQMRILIFHELLHIGIEEKNGKEVYSIVPHDLEDFRTIIRRFGVDWSR